MKPPGERFRAQPEHHSRLWLMVGQDGFEPATNGLKIRCSSAELLPHRSAGIRRTVICNNQQTMGGPSRWEPPRHLHYRCAAFPNGKVNSLWRDRPDSNRRPAEWSPAGLSPVPSPLPLCLLSYCPILPPGNPVTQREVFAVCHILLLQRDIEWQSRRHIFARAG